jgi:hypothetical protein
LTLEAPNGVGGVNAPQVRVEKGQNQGTLEVTLGENATVGAHTFSLRARVQFNGVNLDERVPLALTIDPK